MELFIILLGPLVKKIIHDSKMKINGTLPKERKMFIYSGHEYNIAHTLRALNTFEPHVPPYGAHILFELHKIDGQYGFKVNIFFYLNF